MNYDQLKPLTRRAISASMTNTLMHCLPENHWESSVQELMDGKFDFIKLFNMALHPYLQAEVFSNDVFEAVGNILQSLSHDCQVNLDTMFLHVSIPICKQIMQWHPQKSMVEAIEMLNTEKFGVRELLDLYLKEYNIVGMGQFILEIYIDLENLFRA